MGSRRKARECALQLLYQLDMSGNDFGRVSRQYWEHLDEPVDSDAHEFGTRLVKGVLEKAAEIDDLIASYSTNWKVSRMATVDKNILRLAIFELLHCPDIPIRVTLNEAVEIAKRFGTAESGAFVNGILDNIARENAPDKFKEADHGDQ
jgi:N utilization substance protein B